MSLGPSPSNVGGRTTPGDLAVVAGQLGRPPRDLTGIAARCPFGYPAVIETAPVLAEAPNPTLLYLTCPTIVTAVSRAEATGAVKKFRKWVGTDPEAGRALEQITRWYRDRRSFLARERSLEIRLDAGIGGPSGPERASCLHAYAAALLAVMSGWLGEESDGNPGSAERKAVAGPAEEAGAIGVAGMSGASRPAANAASIRLLQGIWARFLPTVEETWCRDGSCTRFDPCEIRAAIDVGTISVRLLVARAHGGKPETISRQAEVTRLGEGLERNGRLNPDARRRTAAVVATYAQKARCYQAGSIVVAGTSAVREAADGADFIRSLSVDGGVRAMVLSGSEEAELAYAGVSLDLTGDLVVLDVGGGSTELSRGQGGVLEEVVSLELGASRATERWIRTDPPATREIESIYDEAARAIGALRCHYGRSAGRIGESAEAHVSEMPRLVGVAGTVTTLACLDAGLERYDSEVLHLWILAVPRIRELLALLSEMTMEERASLSCVQAGRAPVIVAGSVILLAAMETLGYDEVTVSERDLLDGLVLHRAC